MLVPKAVERLHQDWELLVTFYQFPREHWQHLRMMNVVWNRPSRGLACRPPPDARHGHAHRGSGLSLVRVLRSCLRFRPGFDSVRGRVYSVLHPAKSLKMALLRGGEGYMALHLLRKTMAIRESVTTERKCNIENLLPTKTATDE